MRTLATKKTSPYQKLVRVTPKPIARSLSPNLTMLQRKPGCACGGGCPRCQKEALLQTKLKISEPGDQYEQEADRIADEVMQIPEPSIQRQVEPEEEDEEELVQSKAIATSKNSPTQKSNVPSIVHQVLRSSGQPLDPTARAFFDPRFGHDFSQVRLHTDALSTDSAEKLGARAYTVGTDIAFGTGQYAPETKAGRHLLAHELAHVVQQRQGVSLKIRMSRLSDFNDKHKKHERAKLTDAEIEATDEFKAYMDSKLIWQWQLKVTREEALLAAKLILREMRGGKAVTWESQARSFVLTARKQLGTLKETEKLVGKLQWFPSQESEFKDPANAQSDFARFVLADGPKPTDTSQMNCFEMILFGAFRGGMVTKDRIEKIYKEAAKLSGMAISTLIENSLCKGSKRTFNPTDSKSPEPLPGDIIIFDSIGYHTAISRGTKDASGKHQVISLAGSNDPNFSQKVQKTTIEELLPMTALSTVEFCTSAW